MYCFEKWLKMEGCSVRTVSRRTGIAEEKLEDLRWGVDRLADWERNKLAILMGIDPSDVASPADLVDDKHRGDL